MFDKAVTATDALRNHAVTSKKPPSITSPASADVAAILAPFSAATRVFALPELLEKILLCVSVNARNAALVAEWSVLSYQGPAKELYVLQRVNSTFKATIARNKAMQRDMFLAAYPATKGKLPTSIPWLLEEIGVSVNDCALYAYPLSLGELLLGSKGKDLPAARRSKEASWRKMKLHCIENYGPLSVSVFTPESVYCVHTFAQEDGMTLGKFHDGLQRLIPLMEDLEFEESSEGWIAHDESKDAAMACLNAECARDDLWT